MSTRQLRPRTARITNAFAASKVTTPVPIKVKAEPKSKVKTEPKSEPKSKLKSKKAATKNSVVLEEQQENADGGEKAALDEDGETVAAPPRKKKKLSFGPGETPFPDHPGPTPEECRLVERLLVSVHGASARPEKMEPRPDVSGCGEVPSVLDALMRTILSANTSNTNSSRAFQGLVSRFGVIPKSEPESNVPVENGKKRKRASTGEGSVDWDAVRRAPLKDLFDAIKCGGLADTKSKNMKAILDQVYEECREKRDKQREAEKANPTLDTENAPEKDDDDDDVEMSLDYIHGLEDQAVKDKLTSYKGVGQKTASCVLLFCLQRPSFAVDTHVFRISRFLGWVPPNATRDTAYAHLDLKVPDDIKYSLHNLMIRHGRMCQHCKGGPEKKSGPSPPKKKSLKKEGEESKVVKKTKKIWIGNGMMKEIVVEVEDDGEGGDVTGDRCVLEGLVNRVRKKRVVKVKEEDEADSDEEEE